ncbi:MAG: hypothetical protein MK102_11520, partial [Fuerstiella sp.]|nr:hypothetical protein [Fuerstiella sp.]
MSSSVFCRQVCGLLTITMMLVLSTGGVFGTENVPSSPVAHRQTSSKKTSRTSINSELQRLFRESGRQMPSMRMADLPYTTTPRMDRVRKREAASTAPEKTAPAKTKDLMTRIFGRFRRNKAVTLTASPDVPEHTRTSGRRHEIQTLQPVGERQPRPVTRNQPTRTVLPASQSKTSSMVHPATSRINLIPKDGVVEPFETAEVASELNRNAASESSARQQSRRQKIE